MKDFLSSEDRQNPDIEEEPDVNDPDNAGDTMVFAQVTPPSYNVQIQLPPSSAGKTINVLTSNFQVIASTTANGPVWTVPLKRGTYMVKIVGNGQEKVFDVRGSEPDPPASASSSEAPKKVQLVVTTGDTAAEDLRRGRRPAAMRPGDQQVETWQPPGIYKIKVRTGLSTEEEYVVLRDAPIQKYVAPLSFSSPVPLVNTAKSHEYHQQAAVDQSQQLHVRAGRGVNFVFARDSNAR